MKKWPVLFLVLLCLALLGCSREEMPGKKPPEVEITIGNESYETVLGSYCWKNSCVDTGGPVELLKEKAPIHVKRGEKITFQMNYEPQPNDFYLLEINNENEKEVLIEENNFSAPTQKGIYYYSYGIWWMDEKEENVSRGDAFYAFVLKIE